MSMCAEETIWIVFKSVNSAAIPVRWRMTEVEAIAIAKAMREIESGSMFWVIPCSNVEGEITPAAGVPVTIDGPGDGAKRAVLIPGDKWTCNFTGPTGVRSVILERMPDGPSVVRFAASVRVDAATAAPDPRPPPPPDPGLSRAKRMAGIVKTAFPSPRRRR